MSRVFYLILLLCCSFSFAQELKINPSFKSEERSDLGIGARLLGWDKNKQMWSLSREAIISFDGLNSRSFPIPKLDEKFGEEGPGASYLDVENNKVIITNVSKALFLVFDITKKSFNYIENDNLTDEDIYMLDIYPYDKDKYLVATYGYGVLLLDLKKNEISSFDRLDHPETKGIPSDLVKSISRFDDSTFVFGFFHEGNKNAVIHFYDVHEKKFYPLEIEEYFRDEPKPYKRFLTTSTRIVHTLDVDENKNIIAATYSCLLKIDTKNKRIYRITANKEVDETIQNVDNAVDLMRDENGFYWVITANAGIMLVDMDSHEAKYIQNDPNNASSIASNYPSRIKNDPEGNIWITHRNSEIVNIFNNKHAVFEHHEWRDLDLEYFNRSQQSVPISSIHVHNDSMVFISSGNGLHLYNPNTQKDSIVLRFSESETSYFKEFRGNEKFDKIYNFVVHDGKIYFVKAQNFYSYDIEKNSISQLKWKNRFGLSADARPLFSTPAENASKLYFSSYTSIFELDTKDQTADHIGSIDFLNPESKRIFPVNSVGLHINEREGMIQLGESSFGIIDLETLEFRDFNENREIQPVYPHLIFFQAKKIKDSILATTGNGFISINESDEINFLKESIDFGTEHTPFNFLLKNDSIIYFTTVNALNRLNLKSSEFISYNKLHGLKIDRFLPFDIQEDQNKNVYFISTNGIVRLNPEDLNIFEAPFSVEFASVFTDQDTIYFDFDPEKNENILNEFNTDISSISFQLRTNQSYSSSPTKFYYRLDKDGDWISNGTSNEIRFSSLGFGNYELEVKGENAFGVSSEVYKYDFSIKTPFWLSWWFVLIVVILLSFIVFGLIKVRERKIQEKNRILEGLVTERTKEVVEQKDEAELQRKIVEEKNKEILDSIQYAKRIQSAILPPTKLVKSYLNDSFILYLPKDVVAGDFYWVEPFDNGVIFAAADCTGHGVPGAMVSVVCNNGLNRSVREYKLSKPAEILDKTREIVVNEFEKSEEDVKDGMDISLVNLYTNENQETIVEYAGANNPLWIIRNGTFDIENDDKAKVYNTDGGGYSLLEIKADKQPIGKYDKVKPYTNHQLELKQGDSVYLFSDGFVDQFGGEKGKKYKPINLRKLLFSIQDKNMDEQKIIIESAFMEWKGALEQVDDVCVIGVRL